MYSRSPFMPDTGIVREYTFDGSADGTTAICRWSAHSLDFAPVGVILLPNTLFGQVAHDVWNGRSMPSSGLMPSLLTQSGRASVALGS